MRGSGNLVQTQSTPFSDCFYISGKNNPALKKYIYFMALLIKFIALPLYPVGLIFLVLVVGILAMALKKKYAPVFLILAGILLLFFSSPVVSRMLVMGLEREYLETPILPDECPAIVVLGGGGVAMTVHHKYPEINDAGDRLIHAARLYKKGVAPRVITSGRPVVNVPGIVPEAVHNALLLIEFGVDSSAIIPEMMARNTHEHGPFIAAIFDSLQVPRRIVLVTSASHMRRSVAVFEKEGFTVFPAPTDFRSERGTSIISNFFPSSSALHEATVAFHEYYGLLGYRLLGWI